MNSKEEVKKLNLQGIEIDLPFPVVVEEDIVSLNVVLKKEFEIIKQTLGQLENKNQELKNELKRCQDTIKKWMDNHNKLIIDNGKMKRIIKENFSVYDDEVILVGYYPILEEEIKEVLQDE